MDTVCYNGAFVVPGERGFAPNGCFRRITSISGCMPSIAGFFSRMRIWKFSGGPWAGCGVPFVLPESTLRQAVGALLDANRYPHGSSRITLRVFPHGLESDAEEPSWLLETAAPLYYPRYVLWHKRPLLDVFP